MIKLNIFRKTKTIEDIPTERGNDLLEQLKSEGWKVTSEYSDQMFDKGIDFDGYTLKKERMKLEFTWTNWEEWMIEGDDNSLNAVRGWLMTAEKTDKENKAE